MNRFPEEVDVAIVGSGPTGATYARILSECAPSARVAMFEVGPEVTEPPGAHVKNIVNAQERENAQRMSEGPGAGAATVSSPGEVKAGERKARPGTFLLERDYRYPGEDGLPVAAMSSNVGGMAAHWTGACPRPGGAERMEFVPDLDELLNEAEGLLGVTRDAFTGSPFKDVIQERLSRAVDAGREPAFKVQPMPLAVHRGAHGNLVWSGSDVIFGDITRGNAHFQLFSEALVTQLHVVDGRIAGLDVRDQRTGELSSIRAQMIVVAADALRTPQLLWASGIQPDALGRYLNDQTQVVFATRINDVPASRPTHVAPDAGLSSTSGVTWVPYTDELPLHGQIMQLDASPVPIAEDDEIVPGSIVGLGLFCAKDVQREDRVTFDDEVKDGYGLPQIGIRYRLSEADHALIERAKEEIVRLGRAIGEPLNSEPFVLPLGSSLHYQGTTRMGASNDGESVCGPNSEVWGVSGLFVAGNGVISTSTACNPTLTAVALAIRGAREVASRLRVS